MFGEDILKNVFNVSNAFINPGSAVQCFFFLFMRRSGLFQMGELIFREKGEFVIL